MYDEAIGVVPWINFDAVADNKLGAKGRISDKRDVVVAGVIVYFLALGKYENVVENSTLSESDIDE